MQRDDFDKQNNEKDLTSENSGNISPDISENTEPVAENKNGKPKNRKKHTVRNVILIIIAVLLCLVTATVAALYVYTYRTIDNAEYEPLDSSDLGIETSVYEDVRNIALFGIDSRQDNDVGRSDAIIVLTIDKDRKKIKLSSIARDSYVNIDGHGLDKLTHAYAYGKAQFAVKTLNQNYDLEITDYVSINFFGLERVIDYIGGVTVDITEKERNEINRGMPSNMKLSFAGPQILNGKQALAYSRIRYIDSDIQRTNRQKKVLTAMFETAKKMPVTKLPAMAEMVLKECRTSLTANDIISLGTWGITASPELSQLTIPNKNVPSSGKMIKGVWYYVYDIDTAKKELHDFIHEENHYAPAGSVSAAQTSAE